MEKLGPSFALSARLNAISRALDEAKSSVREVTVLEINEKELNKKLIALEISTEVETKKFDSEKTKAENDIALLEKKLKEQENDVNQLTESLRLCQERLDLFENVRLWALSQVALDEYENDLTKLLHAVTVERGIRARGRCSLCEDRRCDTVLDPCGHARFCSDCIPAMEGQCILCKTKIVKTIKLMN